ncbi:MAG: NAD(+) synthetase [Epsilonproteobacteria bacterium]|nr:MAG: NAD(+) synthetase [Campylobacterota bacterium]
MNHKKLQESLVRFIQDELKQTKVKKLVVGLSGGLDSAIVAILCLHAVGKKNLKCILMPSSGSSKSSITDAKQLCEKFDINYDIVDISNITDNFFKQKKATSLRIGNFCARIRMAVLYDTSSDINGVVVGTSNRSEILLGYGTIYGDTACAFNPIGDIYKSDEYSFASYLGVTNNILTKKPSADLWSGQTDEYELGFNYDKIDEVLKKLIDENIKASQLMKFGFNKKLLDMVQTRMSNNSFKQKLPNIAKLNRET